MRRMEQEITNRKEIEEVIRAALVCRIAVADGKAPHIVPLCFGYEPGRFWFHSAGEGRKIDLLRRCGRASFELEANVELVGGDDACNRSMRYRSVIGAGRVVFVEDEAEKRRGLAAISRQYGYVDESYPPAAVARTTVLRLDVEEMTGKRSE